MSEDRVVTYAAEGNDLDSFRSFRIDDQGIKREGYRLLLWAQVQRVRAWINVGDGDWGMDEVHCLELTYTDGYRLRLTDAYGNVGPVLLYRLQDCIRWFLPAIAPDWQEQVWADYQRHYRRQRWLGSIAWFWYPNKPVIYERPSEEAPLLAPLARV